jgi:hypothetical protein
VILGIAFVVAIVFRLRTFDASTANGRGVSTTGNAAATTSPPAGDDSVPDTGTMFIVENATSAPARSTTNATSRGQRYEDLLRSSPPPGVTIPTPPKPAEKQSLLQRVASAIGLGEEKKAVSAPPPPAPRAPRPSNRLPQQASQSGSSNQTQSSAPESKANPAEESDAESDTRPPQLAGLEFMPNQVQDGETTVLAISANDDLSGIRTISGVIGNPAGATAGGFSAQLDPDSNRFLARIVIPKDAAEGSWHIKYLTMSDNASNSVHLAYGQGLAPGIATFRVTSSRSDAKGPELKSLWIDKRTMSAGEKNTVFVQAEDDKAGVQIVSGVFVSPSKLARIGFGCKLGGSGAWECSIPVPECVDCGVWQLEQIQMQDKANNSTTVRLDNQMVSNIQVDISGDRCDGAAPVLTGLSLNPTSVANGQPVVIQVAATIQDDNCGGSTLSGLVTGPQGQRLNIHFYQSKDGQNFTGTIKLDGAQARGKYVVAWIQALDKGQNLKAYSANDPLVSRATFTVE